MLTTIAIQAVWFQNRRAKWRKQARLQLLQDAWRMRCLGISSPQLVVDPQNPAAGNNNNAPSKKPEDSGSSQKEPEFTLMHPAFQGSTGGINCPNNNSPDGSKRLNLGHSLYQSSQSGQEGMTPTRDVRPVYHLMHASPRIPSHHEDSNSSDLSDGSEEIDLTTNGGCIDYSSNSSSKN